MLLQKAAVDLAIPVILGAGTAGLGVSRALSQAGVSHVLVGDRPGDAPRLGESLNAEGSFEIARQFPELSQYFFEKRQVAVFYGDQALAFDLPQLTAGRAFYSLMGYPNTAPLLHVDRIGFDKALFDLAVRDPCCSQRSGRPASIEYDAASDRVTAVTLASGEQVAASHVFDCTNGARLLARKIGVPLRTFGTPRRVVFAHYRAAEAGESAPATPAGELPAWMFATSLLRLEKPRRAVDGLAWCIPLGSYVSIGVSVDPATTKTNAAALINEVAKAYWQVGIDAATRFPNPSDPVDFRYEHYNHQRCFGRNWLLLGAACSQVWFPSASGVGVGLMAARIAPRWLKDPLGWGRVYQAINDQTLAAHAALDWLATGSPAEMTRGEILRRGAVMIGGNVSRLVSYLELGERPAELAFGEALARFYARDRWLESPLRDVSAGPEAQGVRVFAGLGEPDPWTDPTIPVALMSDPGDLGGPGAVLAVIDALGGRAEATSDLMVGDLAVGIDGFQLTGVAGWQGWLSFVRAGIVPDLQFVAASLAETTPGAGVWTLSGQWRGTRFGQPSVSPEVSMTFTLADDKLEAIQLSAADFTFPCGDQILPRVALAAILAQIAARSEGVVAQAA